MELLRIREWMPSQRPRRRRSGRKVRPCRRVLENEPWRNRRPARTRRISIQPDPVLTDVLADRFEEQRLEVATVDGVLRPVVSGGAASGSGR